MKRVLSLILAALPGTLLAQSTTGLPAYPTDYFRNPLDIPIFLAGNFGECRPGHFHSGIDIKTQGKENEQVHAAADGYISRIKMEKGGFGHALYITHPNGYTTLYAHLNDFAPAIQKYVRREQYERKRWDVDLQLSPAQFPVTKGQKIALSGNTGGSSAPHLHFEIRNTKTEHPLNPELFALPITDEVSPVAAEVVLYNGTVYEGSKLTLSLIKKDGVYKPAKTDNKLYTITKDTVQVAQGNIGVGINADDFMNGSDNTITFLTSKLYLDDNIQAQVTLDDIGYDVSRYINGYADYKTKQLNKKWVQCLFQLPGNRLDGIFSNLNKDKGRITLADNKIHKINIVIADDMGNIAPVVFYVRAQPVADAPTPAKDCIPFTSGKPNTYSDPNISFTLDERQLYDDICFHHKAITDVKALSDRHEVHYPYIPVHHYFDLQMKPNKNIPFDLRSKVIIKYTDGKDEEGSAAAATDQGFYKAPVRNFGTYWLDIDTLGPVIKTQQKDGGNLAGERQITFDVKDNATSVKSFSGYLDGKWICFEQHGSSFFYRFDEHCPKGKHELVFKAEDENGNTSTSKLKFTR